MNTDLFTDSPEVTALKAENKQLRQHLKECVRLIHAAHPAISGAYEVINEMGVASIQADLYLQELEGKGWRPTHPSPSARRMVMTTNKPGSASQPPLFGCVSCIEYQTFPADHLRVFDGNCYCGDCWDAYPADDGTEWADLKPFVPAIQAECEQLRDGIRAVLFLIDTSTGVDGLHHNGDIAPWHEIRRGGAFESWLIDFDDALEAMEL